MVYSRHMNHANFFQSKPVPLPDKFLGLKEFRVLDVDNQPHQVLIYVDKINKGEMCPKCAHFSHDHHSYRTKERRIQDLPIHGKPTYLIIRTERFDCSCGERGITESYESIAKGAHKTKRFEEYLNNNNHHNTFQNNARQNKLSASSIFGRFKRLIQKNFVSIIAQPFQGVLPSIINMDDVSRKKGHKYMTVIADYSKKNCLR